MTHCHLHRKTRNHEIQPSFSGPCFARGMEGKGEEEAEAATPAFTRSGSAGVDKSPRAPKTRTLPHTETRLFVEGKVVVVGDMSVGKTCVVARFTKDGVCHCVCWGS